jgi:hypothetical protein
MTRLPDPTPFAVRLARAYHLLASSPPDVPISERDQLDAAGREVHDLHDRMGVLLPVVAPDRSWFHRTDSTPSTAVRAYLLAALLGCMGAVCVHLRKGGPQPAFVQLPLRRIDCARCVGTIRRPPPENAGQCDVCDRHGVVTFSPFAARQGPLLVAGDACPTCAGVLGIKIEREA